jgi:septum formation protein
VIVLASASAIRAKLLRNAGVPFEARPSPLNEEEEKALHAEQRPRDIAKRLAEAKAMATPAGPDDLVIGADQTLELDGKLINKVADLAAARARLRSLRGREHRLHSAAALVRAGQVVWVGVYSPRLVMRAFSDAFLESYLADHGEAALSSVGCYLLEDAGAQLFERIDGDYFAILGLPLIELLAALRAEGALAA